MERHDGTGDGREGFGPGETPNCPFQGSEALMSYPATILAASALLLDFCFCLALPGCSRAPLDAPAAEPIPVTVSYPIERQVADYADFTARIAAVDSVEVRGHSWGYLDKVNFKEGDLVKKGDVLFKIDPRPYQAILNQAKAKVAQDEAQLKLDEAEYRRNRDLITKNAISQSDLDKSAAARDIDIANIAADKAVVASRQLELDYTEVVAPVSGRRQPIHRHGRQFDPVGGPEQRHLAHDDRVGGPDVRLL